MNTSVPSISSHTLLLLSPPPPSPAYERNIRNITDWSLFLFNVTLVLSRSCIGNRGMHVRKRVYRSVREVYYFFFLFFSTPLLSLSFSHFFFLLCARVYRSPGFVWKKGRDTFLITNREPRLDTSIFGHWHATIFFFYGSFYMLVFLLLLFFFLLIFSDSDILPFRFRVVEMEKECFRWLFRD